MLTLMLAAILPLQEMQTVKSVAREYGLDRDQTALLVAIRKTENGRLGSGVELGVGQEIPNHPAKRFKGDPMKSLRLQCQWGAGTIKRRYKGDIAAFSRRWCPKNHAVWHRNATYFHQQALREI